MQFLAVAPNGTIYANTRTATYAIDPGGKILWSNPIAPADGVPHSISIGSDGTIYTGMGLVSEMYSMVVALNPEDGSIKWQYLPPEHATLTVGPNIGPDGNIFGLLELSKDNSNHAFSLDPAGALRWMNAGDLPVWPTNIFTATSDVEFGDDFMVAGHVKVDFSNPTLHAFSLEGQFLWGADSASPGTHTMPTVDPQNRTFCSWGQTGIQAIGPDGDQELVVLHPDGANFLQRPAVDSKGNVYVGDFIGIDLWSLNPDGTTRWLIPTTDEIMAELSVSPDDQFLIVHGNGGANGPFWIRGYSTADGELLWQIDLPPEGEFTQFANPYEVAFSPDDSVAYVTTTFAGAGIDHGFLYAIHLSETTLSDPADVTGDGAVNVDDLLSIINAWGPCNNCEACPEDIIGDCIVNVDDLVMVINNWN